MPGVCYSKATEVAEIAQGLIEKYHHHLLDYSVRVEYVFVDKIPKKGGKEIWGSCRKISNLNAFLASDNPDGDPFYVITIALPIWDLLPEKSKIALVDHELCHTHAEYCEDDEDPAVKLSMTPHDLEEFSCIVRRHGLWRDDIKDFVETAKKTAEVVEEDV
jgi:predicted metallopeptidase